VDLRIGPGTRRREGETRGRGERRKGDGETRREAEGKKGRRGRIMVPELNGIEQRLERLEGCLLKPEPLKIKINDEFALIPTSRK